MISDERLAAMIKWFDGDRTDCVVHGSFAEFWFSPAEEADVESALLELQRFRASAPPNESAND